MAMQQWLNTVKTICAIKSNVEGTVSVADDSYFIEGNATVAADNMRCFKTVALFCL
jgi:hypothetical protein